MRNIIIDNSTLTAVQRLTGKIEVENTYSLDGDISAFETLIQSILFYDTLFFIDDYKEEFKKLRRDQFRYITPIGINMLPYEETAKAAAQFVSEITLSAQRGRIQANDIGKFLNELNMQTTFTWDLQSSDWFLTLKMLEGVGGVDVDKYSALNNMIFSELSSSGETISPRPEGKIYSLIGPDGREIPRSESVGKNKRAISRQVVAFAAGLNWLAMRTAFYSYIASQYDADVALHPIRSAFQFSLGAKLGLPVSVYEPVLQRFASQTADVVREIKSPTEPFLAEMKLPLLSAWLVDKAGSAEKAIDLAFEMRQSPGVRDARKRLLELEQLIDSGDQSGFVKEANRLIAEITQVSDTMRQLYAVKPKNGISLSPLIAIYNVVGKLKGLPSIPALPIKIPVPDGVRKIGLRGGFKGTCRSVTQDLAAVSRLGQYYEKMTRAVSYKGGKPQTYKVKTEEVEYLRVKSFWKQPM